MSTEWVALLARFTVHEWGGDAAHCNLSDQQQDDKKALVTVLWETAGEGCLLADRHSLHRDPPNQKLTRATVFSSQPWGGEAGGLTAAAGTVPWLLGAHGVTVHLASAAASCCWIWGWGKTGQSCSDTWVLPGGLGEVTESWWTWADPIPSCVGT